MKTNNPISLICILITIIFSPLCNATGIFEAASELEIENHPNNPQFEGDILFPVAALGDTTQFVVALDDDYMCGVSQSRLKIFTKKNASVVTSSYWSPYRLVRTFSYYKDYIYLINTNREIEILDVRDPENIRLAGIINCVAADYAEFEIFKDKLFFVNTRTNSLIISSLTNPEEPLEISRYNIPQNIGNGCKIRIVKNKIYILCSSGLAILDIQNISSPELLGRTNIQSDYSLGAFVVKEPYAYVCTASGFRIYDISEPDTITEITRAQAGWCSHAILRDGSPVDYFIGFGMNGLDIFDISNPLEPTAVRSQHNKMPGNFIVGKSEDYIVNEDGSVEQITGWPYFPSQIEDDNPCVFGFNAINIAVNDAFAYIFGSHRMWIFDISQPWFPEYIADIESRSGMGDRIKIIAKDNYIYSPYEIVDVSEPAAPEIIKMLDGGSSVAIKDDYLLVAKQNTLQIWDIQIPSEAEIITDISIDERLNHLSVHKGVLYLGLYYGKVRSCKLCDDFSLTTLDEIELSHSTMGILLDFYCEDNLLYTALNTEGIASIDISNPHDLQIYSRFNTSQCSEKLFVANTFAYVADGSGGTLIIDMTRGFERQIASYQTTGWARSLAVSGNYVFSCESDNGILILYSRSP